jgi:hypothetical protein
MSCLRRFQLIYVEKLATPPGADLAFGSAVHSGVNAVLMGEDGEAVFEVYWDSYAGKDLDFGRYNWEQMKELGLNFISKFKRAYAPKFKVVQAEVRMYGEYRGLKLEGTMDFLGEYDGVMTMADFKTASVNYMPDKARAALQLYLYSYLAIKTFGVRPEQIMYLPFIKSAGSIQRPLIHKLDDAQMYEALDSMVDQIESFNLEKYPKNYNACFDYNKRCPFFERCHGGKNESN